MIEEELQKFLDLHGAPSIPPATDIDTLLRLVRYWAFNLISEQEIRGTLEDIRNWAPTPDGVRPRIARQAKAILELLKEKILEA